MSRRRLAIALLAALATPIALAQQGVGPDAPERAARAKVEAFADHVVRVLVVGEDNQVRRQGWGLLVGRQRDDLYIATPFHVVQDHDSRSTDRIEVRFHAAAASPVAVEMLVSLANSFRIYFDLAVLVAHGAAGRAPDPAPVVSLGPPDGGAWVWTIGRQASWDLSGSRGGFVHLRHDPERLVFDNLHTPPGTSGQTVASADGLIGMVTNDGGEDETWAVAITKIIEQFLRVGHPVNLLTRAGEQVPDKTSEQPDMMPAAPSPGSTTLIGPSTSLLNSSRSTRLLEPLGQK